MTQRWRKDLVVVQPLRRLAIIADRNVIPWTCGAIIGMGPLASSHRGGKLNKGIEAISLKVSQMGLPLQGLVGRAAAQVGDALLVGRVPPRAGEAIRVHGPLGVLDDQAIRHGVANLVGTGERKL